MALLLVLLRQIFGRKPVYLLDLHCFQPPERYSRHQSWLCRPSAVVVCTQALQ